MADAGTGRTLAQGGRWHRADAGTGQTLAQGGRWHRADAGTGRTLAQGGRWHRADAGTGRTLAQGGRAHQFRRDRRKDNSYREVLPIHTNKSERMKRAVACGKVLRRCLEPL